MKLIRVLNRVFEENWHPTGNMVEYGGVKTATWHVDDLEGEFVITGGSIGETHLTEI